MTTVADVAEYVLRAAGPMTAMKLQKLVYYAKAWHLVWDEEPLFPERIEAWANGPVVPDLYRQHATRFSVSAGLFSRHPSALPTNQVETIDVVLQYYGDRSAAELSDITHAEAPWREARGDLAPGARSHAEITEVAMYDYYSSLNPEA